MKEVESEVQEFPETQDYWILVARDKSAEWISAAMRKTKQEAIDDKQFFLGRSQWRLIKVTLPIGERKE